MDPTFPIIDSTQFQVCDWREFYSDVEEPISSDVPQSIGIVVDLHLFVDSDHAGDQHTQRSCTCFLIYLNTAIISWYSKRQSTMEICTFSTEFVAMKMGIETPQGICYKLRMMSIPLVGATHICRDSMSMIIIFLSQNPY